MKHIVFYSGGLGSWMTAKRVIEQHGKENVILHFTDTKFEDEDLYRFLIDTFEHFFGQNASELRNMLKDIPNVLYREEYKAFLDDLEQKANETFPNVAWISDGRDPWDVFKEIKWIGNSRRAQCSRELKQKLSREWVEDNFTTDECTLYLGIDWTEMNRKRPELWHPYTVEYPMCEAPYMDKLDMRWELKKTGIELPRLYKLNMSHNNCGSMCVRGGQGHWINVLRTMPDRYAYAEQKEQEMREFLDKDYSILKKTRNDETFPLTLKQLREEYQNNSDQIDMFDIGGCGCFVSYEEEKTCKIATA